MKEYFKDYTFDDWDKLPKEKKVDIINNYWDPFDSTIGQKTKSTIIDNFLKNQNSESVRQAGIKNFGFYAVQLFIITDNSELKIPTEYAGLIINKGIIEKQIKGNTYRVKWRDGGHDDIDLTDKIIIR